MLKSFHKLPLSIVCFCRGITTQRTITIFHDRFVRLLKKRWNSICAMLIKKIDVSKWLLWKSRSICCYAGGVQKRDDVIEKLVEVDGGLPFVDEENFDGW